MLGVDYLDINKVYNRLVLLLSQRHKSISQLSQDDPFNILIGFIALSSIIGSTYIQKVIENKYVRYPIVDTKSNLNVLENFGIRPRPIIPSALKITLEYTAGLIDNYVTIPYNTRFSVLYDEFVTFDNYYLLPNSTYTTVTAYKGEIREEEFGIADIVDQKLPLSYKNVVADKVIVVVDGTEYKYTDFCLYRRGTGIYGIEYEYDDTFYISLPINYTDYIFTNSRINVRYLIADSTINYDPTQEIVELTSSIYTEDGLSIGNDFEVYNIESFSYGDSRHTTSFCYKNLGKLLSTFGKAVTTEDYKILTDYYPGVAVSAAYDINSERRMDPFIYIQIPYYTKVVVAPTENYYPTEYLKQELYDYYDKVGVDRNQVFIQIIDPRYRLVDVVVLIHSKHMSPSEVLDSYNLIYDAIRAFFKVGNLEFGSVITENILKSVAISADANLLYSDAVEFDDFKTVYCEADELPILGRLTLIFNYERKLVKDYFWLPKVGDGDNSGDIDSYYTLLREYLEPMSTGENNPGVLEDRLVEVGPRATDIVYFSDTIYRDEDIVTDITVMRFTNLISVDRININLGEHSSITISTDQHMRVSDHLEYEDNLILNKLSFGKTSNDNMIAQANIRIVKNGVEYRWIYVTENCDLLGG